MHGATKPRRRDGEKMGMQIWQRYQMAEIMMVLLLQKIKHKH